MPGRSGCPGFPGSGAVAYPVEGVLHRDGVEVGERPSAVVVAVRPEAVVVDVGVLLADRAEGSLSAGIAQGIDEPTISLLIVGLLANVIFLTFIAAIVGREVGLWETLPVVTAIVWALTTGFSLLLHLRSPAEKSKFALKPAFARYDFWAQIGIKRGFRPDL